MATEVKYDGPEPVRDINVGEGRSVRVEKGETVKVPDAVAKSLCEQEYFSRPSEARSQPESKSTTDTRGEVSSQKKEE